MKLYHADLDEYDILNPVSLDLGNKYNPPGWSLFCFKDYEKAVSYGLGMAIRRAYKKKYGEKMALLNTKDNKKSIVPTSTYSYLINLIKYEDIVYYVYTVNVDIKDVHIGQQSYLDEYTIRKSVKPTIIDRIHVNKDMIDKYIEVVPDVEYTKYSNEIRKTNIMMNRGILSFFLLHDTAHPENMKLRKKITDAVRNGELSHGDDIIQFMKENDYSFKEIGMIERLLLTVQNKNLLKERSNIMNESNNHHYAYKLYPYTDYITESRKKSIIGKKVHCIVDRPMNSYHPEKKNIFYPINYGYVEGIIGGDGEEQDVYILDVDKPIKSIDAYVIGIIHRTNDNEDKWVVSPKKRKITEEEIREKTNFMEQWFESEIILESTDILEESASGFLKIHINDILMKGKSKNEIMNKVKQIEKKYGEEGSKEYTKKDILNTLLAACFIVPSISVTGGTMLGAGIPTVGIPLGLTGLYLTGLLHDKRLKTYDKVALLKSTKTKVEKRIEVLEEAQKKEKDPQLKAEIGKRLKDAKATKNYCEKQLFKVAKAKGEVKNRSKDDLDLDFDLGDDFNFDDNFDDWSLDESAITESIDKSKIDNNFKKKTDKKNFKYIDIQNPIAEKYFSELKADNGWIKKNKIGEIVIDTDTDKYAGMVLVDNEQGSDEKGFIAPMVVEKEYRGYGLSNKLISDAVYKYKATKLFVYKDNEVAIKLYQKHGFKIVGDYKKDKRQYYMTLYGKVDNRAELLDESTEILQEYNLVLDKDNIEYNLESLKPIPGENILFITGYSGAGKSTTMSKIKEQYRDNVITVAGDYFYQLCRYKYVIENNIRTAKPKWIFPSKECRDFVGPIIYKYMETHYDKIHITNDTFRNPELGKYWDSFILWLYDECESNIYNGKIIVVEGVQMHVNEIDLYKDRPMIIMGTSMKTSYWRKAKRDIISEKKYDWKHMKTLFSMIPAYHQSSKQIDKLRKIMEESTDIIYETRVDKNDCKPVFLVTIGGSSGFSAVIKSFTHSEYSHSGISLTPDLSKILTFNAYSPSAAVYGNSGFAVESIDQYTDSNPNGLIQVLVIFLKNKDYETLVNNINEIVTDKKAAYSFKGIIDIVFNRSINNKSHTMICSEFVDFILKTINVDLTNKSSNITLPKDIAAIKNPKVYKIYEGPMVEYDERIVKVRLNNLYKKAEYIKEATLLYEAKELGVKFDEEGDLIIKNPKGIDFKAEHAKSKKLFPTYKKYKNLDGMKYEACKLWYMNIILLNKAEKERNIKKKDELYDMRAKVMNEFALYINEINKLDNEFNFDAYYKATPFNTESIKISGSTIKYSAEYLKLILK